MNLNLQVHFQSNALPSAHVGTVLPWALPARSLSLCFLDLVASGDQTTRPAGRQGGFIQGNRGRRRDSRPC